MRRSVDERFENFLIYVPPGECILWGGWLTRNGYGGFGDENGENIYAHVYAWFRVNGPVPKGKVICHSRECCSRACVFIGHLRADTQKANLLDASVMGRLSVRLLDEHVLDLRDMYRAGESRKTIERKYGITPTTISAIATGREWSHLPGACAPRQVRPHGIVASRGERHGNSKLQAPQVLEIRARRAAGESTFKLAAEFGVEAQTIGLIVSRKIWAWLSEPSGVKQLQ